MKKRLADLAERRRQLLAEIAGQRMEVSEIFRDWQKPLSLVDSGLKVVGFIHRHFGVLTGIAGLLAFRRKATVEPAQKE